MANKKCAHGGQRNGDNVHPAVTWIGVVTVLLGFQVLFPPGVVASTISQPSVLPTSSVNVGTDRPESAGNATTRTTPATSAASTSHAMAVEPNSTTQPLDVPLNSSDRATQTPTWDISTTPSDGNNQPSPSDQMPVTSTANTPSDSTNNSNTTSITVNPVTKMSTLSTITPTSGSSPSASITRALTSFSSTTPSDAPSLPASTVNSTLPSQFSPTAAPVTTPKGIADTTSATPTNPSQSLPPAISTPVTSTFSIPGSSTQTQTSSDVQSQEPSSTANVKITSALSTVAYFDTTWPTVAMVTTRQSQTGASLTTEQWIGIGVGVGIFLAITVILACLLVWMRARRNQLTKKPSIQVSREDYSNSSTLALKDPQWRKSLTMALQSMNTHIELPKETNEEMQAVDNAAYVEESHDPQTSNQDLSHLTKV
ncbi:mucin-5AC-like [Acanthaster planci]|uniref:Mucin-5AC-like n=1 Tax=Acanthaster planci TaxID=133434 RepID=A0A8B7XTF1_ACAPL|nr:mucin-5AC-like [Acanthaster planci]XP_022083492.1 mucin-5AC-like [Acanthaster planci]XP_022083493.1 mucin-5AC-like [Acanthaster planci]